MAAALEIVSPHVGKANAEVPTPPASLMETDGYTPMGLSVDFFGSP
jgi:hypothetical protein